MPESLSQRIADHLREAYPPGSSFTSIDIAKHFGYDQAIGSITGFLFKARTKGAIAVTNTEPVRPGVTRLNYTVVDMSKVNAAPTFSHGGKPGRKLVSRHPMSSLAKAQDPTPTPVSVPETITTERPPRPANPALVEVKTFVDMLSTEVDRLMAEDRAKAEAAEIESLPSDQLMVLADRVMSELRRRLP